MAHYAKVVDGKVVNVMVADLEFMTNGFVDTSPGEWIQTSFNTWGGINYTIDEITGNKKISSDQSKSLRKNFAGIGFSYDRDLDAFIPPKPFDSWTLNLETGLWDPPTPMPIDITKSFIWNEEEQRWDSKQ